MKWYMQLLIDVTLASFLIIHSSCINIRYPAKGKPVVLRDNTSLIFGRIQVFEDDVDVTRDFCDPMSFFSSTEKLMSFTLLDLEGRKIAPTVVTENDGSFYWVLPTGYFRLIKLEYRTVVDPYLAFRVHESNKCVYIGNIVLKSESKMVPHISLSKHTANINMEFSVISIEIEDRYEYESDALKARFPDIGKGVVKSLMFTNHDK